MPKRKPRRKSKKSIFSPLVQGLKAGGSLFLRALPLFLATAAVLGLFFGVRKVLYADGRLVIDQVVVVPSTGLTRSSMRSLEAEVLGRNILDIDLDAIAVDLQKNPQIQSARVSRQMPSTLKVDILTRQPIAFIQFSSGGSYGLVSTDGVILDVAPQSNLSLPTIEAYNMGYKRPEAGTQIREASFRQVVDFLSAYWKLEIAKREPITRVTVDTLNHITVVMGQGGPEVRLGRRPSQRMTQLNQVFSLLEGPGRETIQYIDLQYDNLIVKRK